MKLLDRKTAQSKIQKDNDTLVESNIRLRGYYQEITKKLNIVKDSYEPDKLLKLKEFEAFVKDIQAKKSRLLQELHAIGQQVEQKKELYYALITKQDALDERLYKMNEKERKLDLREAFVVDLEQKWRLTQE